VRSFSVCFMQRTIVNNYMMNKSKAVVNDAAVAALSTNKH